MITCLGLACLAIILCGIGLNTPRAQAQDLGPAAAPDCTLTVTVTASCVAGHVVLNWTAKTDVTSKLTVSYMGATAGPTDLKSSNSYYASGSLDTGVGSEPAGVATFTLYYNSGSSHLTKTPSVAALRCNAPTAVNLRTFTAASGAEFAFIDRLWHDLGIAR